MDWPYDLAARLISGAEVSVPNLVQYFYFNVVAGQDDSVYDDDGTVTSVALVEGISGNGGDFTNAASRILL